MTFVTGDGPPYPPEPEPRDPAEEAHEREAHAASEAAAAAAIDDDMRQVRAQLAVAVAALREIVRRGSNGAGEVWTTDAATARRALRAIGVAERA